MVLNKLPSIFDKSTYNLANAVSNERITERRLVIMLNQGLIAMKLYPGVLSDHYILQFIDYELQYKFDIFDNIYYNSPETWKRVYFHLSAYLPQKSIDGLPAAKAASSSHS